MKRNFSSLLPANDNPSSLANKYGISTKENHPQSQSQASPVLGLNPNLNIEDEYIENLLKQIHFMNLEIKLIKEKQSQSNGNALWGIINRSNQPMVSNLVQSSQKYQRMRKEADAHLYRLERDIAGLDNNQGALLNQIKFLERKRDEIVQKNKKWDDECKEKHKVLDQKIENHTRKLKTTVENLQKEKKINKELTETNLKSTNQSQLQKSKRQKENMQITNDEIIEERIQSQLTGQIALVKVMIAGLIKSFEENPDYIQATEEEKVLKEKITKFEEAILKQNFEINQTIDSIKMAEVEKDKEIRQRKLLTEQYEQKKTMLAEMVKLNAERKQKQTGLKKRESPQIIKAEQQTVKLQRSLEEIKKKLIKNEEVNLLVSNEVLDFENEIQRLKQKKTSLQGQIARLVDTNSKLETERSTFSSQLNFVVNDYEKTLQTQTTTSLELFEVQRELQYLRERRDLLMKNIQLKDVINELKIEDLEKVVQKNKDLNSTVASLMTKWDEIKDFSRM